MGDFSLSFEQSKAQFPIWAIMASVSEWESYIYGYRMASFQFFPMCTVHGGEIYFSIRVRKKENAIWFYDNVFLRPRNRMEANLQERRLQRNWFVHATLYC